MYPMFAGVKVALRTRTEAAMTIDIYARVSRKGDNEQRSTGSQAAACKQVLRDKNLTPGETFTDDGKSAWNPRVKRPAWEQLMSRLHTIQRSKPAVTLGA
jgi:site-specific DNA recombinase